MTQPFCMGSLSGFVSIQKQLSILAGARKFLSSEFAPRKIIMEMNPPVLANNGNATDLMQNEFTTLFDHGYVAYGMDTREKIAAGWEAHLHSESRKVGYANPVFDKFDK